MVSVWFSFPYIERTLAMTDTYLTEHDNRLEDLKGQMTQEIAGLFKNRHSVS